MPSCSANYNALRRQLKALDRFQGNPVLWHDLLENLVDQHPIPDEDGNDQCCERPVLLNNGPRRPPIPVIPNEVVVEADGAGLRDQVEQILADFGFDPVPVNADGRDGDFVRRYRSDRRSPDLAGVLAAINDRTEASAVPNVLRAMNVVTKSKSGAEPACCHPEAPAFEVDDEDTTLPLIVVIDTGKFLDGHGGDWLKAVTGDPDPRLGPDGYLNLSAGHGTFIAGVIRQLCPESRVRVTHLLSPVGHASDDALAAAIRAAGACIANNGGHGVINLSLGGEDYKDKPPSEVKEALLELPACVAVVAAAGNRNSGERAYPAAFSDDPDLDHVASVASLDSDGNPSTWSNRGSWVTFSAVGEGIVSTYLEGEERPGTGADSDPHDPEPDEWIGNKPWAVWTGTSFAAPQIAAVLAQRLAAACRQEEPCDVAAVIAALHAEYGGDDPEAAGFGARMPRGDAPMVVEAPKRPDGDPEPHP